MMYFHTKEERDKEAMKHIKALKECAGLFALIKPVLQDFDGKCFNCRLEKALQDRTGKRIYAKKQYRYIYIYTYDRINQQRTLAQIALDEMPDEKRIPAEKLIASAREKRESFLKEANEIKKTMENAEMIKAQMMQLEKALKNLSDSVKSYTAREIYGLNIRFQWR